MAKNLITLLLLIFLFPGIISAQENDGVLLENQISLNLSYVTLGSLDFSYERTIGKKIAIGLGYTNYGNAHQDLNLEDFYTYNDYKINFEINPFARLYIHGAQNRSLFLELLGSYNEAEVSEAIIRKTNSSGYGVYQYGAKIIGNIGIGTGIGYRFLLVNNRLVLEAQIGIRKNFDDDFFYNSGIVRTGIKVGYRF